MYLIGQGLDGIDWAGVGIKWSWMRQGHKNSGNSSEARVVAVAESKLLAGLASSACTPRSQPQPGEPDGSYYLQCGFLFNQINLTGEMCVCAENRAQGL